jgi:hypothetical protein
MKKIALSLITTLSLFSGEFRYGHGDMTFSGGFLGFNQDVTEDIDTYTLVETHKNITGSKMFYAYSITWYDSAHFKQMQSAYNGTVTTYSSIIPSPTDTTDTTTTSTPVETTGDTLYIPTMDYSLQGLDASFSLGYDLYKKDENNYFGIAGYLGIDLPTIDSQKDSDYESTLPDDADREILKQFFLPSETDIMIYKIGAAFYSRASIVPTLSVYANGVYAYQTGNIENDYADSDFDVDGTYASLDIGLRFQPVEEDYKVLGITWSPRVFVTAGYKMERWKLEDVAIDISGMGLEVASSDMKIDTDIFYLGIGYTF